MPELTELDLAFLEALRPFATNLEATHPEGVITEDPIILKAVVIYKYLDSDGVESWAYRRCGIDWIETAGAAEMLRMAHDNAWRDSNA